MNDVNNRIFREFRTKLDNLHEDRLFFEFRKTYDKQRRYYLVLLPNENKENYNYIRDIALPRVTRLLFIKFRGGFLNLSLNLSDTICDLLLVAAAVNDNGVLFLNLYGFCTT